MKKALRIGYNQYCNDEVFARHLKFIKENISVIDELALFAECSHYGYRELESEKQKAALIKNRIEQYREVGVKSVGINLLCTLGHLEEGWGVFPRAPFQYQVNESGVESKACLCPADRSFLEHTAKRYALYSSIGADFIWMDDDIRPNNHGVVRNFCFCNGCIEDFNRGNGTHLCREELTELIRSDVRIRQAWEARRDRVMTTLLTTIEQAVHKAAYNTELGYMSTTDNAKKEWITKSNAKKLRPGGGFYKDDRPIEVFEKAFRVQRQLVNCPTDISDIQYEYEAFNYQTLEKSAHMSELETTLALMSGCTGVLYNDDIFEDRQQTVDMLKCSSDKWDTLCQLNHKCTPVGVYCTWRLSTILNEIGIPTTPFSDKAVAAVLIGEDLKDMTDSDIRGALEKNLFTDGEGLEILRERGFGGYCGGKVKSVYDSGMAERFCNNVINGEYGGHYRDVFMNFKFVYDHSGKTYELEPFAGAEILSRLETVTHIPLGCSMYRFEGTSGLRFAADGYLFPKSVKSLFKREQLGNLIDWLSSMKLPIRVKSSVKIIPTVTADTDGGINIMLTNASFDLDSHVECTVRSAGEFRVIGDNGELLPVEQTHMGSETVIKLGDIRAWNYVLLTNKIR